MKKTCHALALGLATAALATSLVAAPPAEANGALKGMRGTYTPVPAPVPIPDYRPQYYLRADLAVGFGLAADFTGSGKPYGRDEFSLDSGTSFDFGDGTFFTSASHAGNSGVGHALGFGAGYYYSPKWRFDLTAELRMMKSNTATGTFEYDDATVATTQVFGRVTDRTTLRSGIVMASAYYDMDRNGTWNPYVGAGLGFAVNELQRDQSMSIASCSSLAPPCDASTASSAGSFRTIGGTHYTYSLAANLSAGVTYRMSNITSLDLNYRYLYVGGTSVDTSINGHTNSSNIEDQHEHYLRAGLRWDIN